jgi:hypothetical protein
MLLIAGPLSGAMVSASAPGDGLGEALGLGLGVGFGDAEKEPLRMLVAPYLMATAELPLTNGTA